MADLMSELIETNKYISSATQHQQATSHDHWPVDHILCWGANVGIFLNTSILRFWSAITYGHVKLHTRENCSLEWLWLISLVKTDIIKALMKGSLWYLTRACYWWVFTWVVSRSVCQLDWGNYSRQDCLLCLVTNYDSQDKIALLGSPHSPVCHQQARRWAVSWYWYWSWQNNNLSFKFWIIQASSCASEHNSILERYLRRINYNWNYNSIELRAESDHVVQTTD